MGGEKGRGGKRWIRMFLFSVTVTIGSYYTTVPHFPHQPFLKIHDGVSLIGSLTPGDEM